MTSNYNPEDFEGEGEIYLPIQGHVAHDSADYSRVVVEGDWRLRGTTGPRNWPTGYVDEDENQFVAFSYDPNSLISEIDIGYTEKQLFVIMAINPRLARKWAEELDPIEPDSLNIEKHWPRDSRRPVILNNGDWRSIVLWRPHLRLDQTLRSLPLKHTSPTLKERTQFAYRKFGLSRSSSTSFEPREGRNPEKAKELRNEIFGE